MKYITTKHLHDFCTRLTKSFEEFTEKEMEMLQNNTHPGIKECLAKLLHNIEQKILLFRSRRDIEIEKILKEFEASKEAAISEARALEQEMACSLQKSLINQLEELDRQYQGKLVELSTISRTPISEINSDLIAIKSRVENLNQYRSGSTSNISFSKDKLLYCGETFHVGDMIKIECPGSEHAPGNPFAIKSIQDNGCIIVRDNDSMNIDSYQLETGQYTIKKI